MILTDIRAHFLPLVGAVAEALVIYNSIAGRRIAVFKEAKQSPALVCVFWELWRIDVNNAK